MKLKLDENHCGSCGAALDFQERPDNRKIASCCGRTYCVTMILVEKKKRGQGIHGETKQTTSDVARNQIDYQYNGNAREQFQWE